MDKKNVDVDIQEINHRYELSVLKASLDFQRKRIDSLERRLFIICMAITLLGGVFWGIQLCNLPKSCNSQAIKESMVQTPATTPVTLLDSLAKR